MGTNLETSHGQMIKILGVGFNNNGIDKKSWGMCIDDGKRILDKMKGNSLPYNRKSITLKTLLLPEFLHLAKISPLPKKTEKQIDNMIEKFVQKGYQGIKIRTYQAKSTLEDMAS